MISRKVITGCESRGDAGSPYLTRWTLLKTRFGAVYLHIFHRSDADEMHDHPWGFCSVVLWPGYHEVIPNPRRREWLDWPLPETVAVRRWPLLPAFRRAEWRHRVQLFARPCDLCLGQPFRSLICPRCGGSGRIERPCWSLVLTGPRVREWGFFTREGWTEWRRYFRERGC